MEKSPSNRSGLETITGAFIRQTELSSPSNRSGLETMKDTPIAFNRCLVPLQP